MKQHHHFPIAKTAFRLLIFGLCFISSFSASSRPRLEPVSDIRKIMGTFVEITAYGANAKPAIEAAFDRMEWIESQVGRDQTSDISRINNEAGRSTINVRADTWQIMLWARRYWLITDKAFDVTAGPLVNLWGFGYDGQGCFPTRSEISNALPKIGSDKIVFDSARHAIKLAVTGMSITVGGIAKGYAVEEASKVLIQRGITAAIINGGGSSIKVIGSGPPGRPWRIGIEDPRHPDRLLGMVTLKSGQATGTSADDKRFFIKNGRRYSHIIDPRTGYPANQNIAQVTVIAANATEADILTKALFLNDIEWSLLFLKQRRIPALIVRPDGRFFTTGDLKLER